MFARRLLLLGGLALLACAATRVHARSDARRKSAHDFGFVDIDGEELPLSRFAGKPLMIVNTASRCGFTYQYDGLQALYDRYRDQGFVLLAVPSDDFGGQELDSEAEVKHFCEVNFNLDFPMTSITRVRGRRAHPFYTWAREVLGPSRTPNWNFHKYLIDGSGRLVDAFSTRIEPDAPRVRSAVEKLLEKGA
ncbi:MAG: glutathione peroxidase [Pseudomonadota bacterium]